MAGGRDLVPRSPRWLNALIWSSGLGAAAFFVWQSLFCDSEPNCLAPGVTALAARVIAAVMLPALLAVTVLARAVRWVLE